VRNRHSVRSVTDVIASIVLSTIIPARIFWGKIEVFAIENQGRESVEACDECVLRRWSWQEPEIGMTPRDRNPHASLVWLGDSDRAIILNAEGELIVARLDPTAIANIVGPRLRSSRGLTGLRGEPRICATDKELVCVSLEEGAP